MPLTLPPTHIMRPLSLTLPPTHAICPLPLTRPHTHIICPLPQYKKAMMHTKNMTLPMNIDAAKSGSEVVLGGNWQVVFCAWYDITYVVCGTLSVNRHHSPLVVQRYNSRSYEYNSYEYNGHSYASRSCESRICCGSDSSRTRVAERVAVPAGR